MSDSSGKKEQPPKKKCTSFEPQLFRKNLCKNCFKTKAEHSDSSEDAQTPPQQQSAPSTPTTPTTPASPPLFAGVSSAAASAPLPPAVTTPTPRSERVKEEDVASSNGARAVTVVDQGSAASSAQTTLGDSHKEETPVTSPHAPAVPDDTSAATVVESQLATSDREEVSEIKASERNGDHHSAQNNTVLSHEERGIDDKHTDSSTFVQEEAKVQSPLDDTVIKASSPALNETKDNLSALGDTEEVPLPVTSGGRYYAGRDDDALKYISDDEVQRQHPDVYNINNGRGHRSYSDDEQSHSDLVKQQKGGHRHGKSRRVRSRDDTDFEGTKHRLNTFALELDRNEAMMEGSRMLIDNLREKLAQHEERNEHLQKEKKSLQELLNLQKQENNELYDEYQGQVRELDDKVKQLQSQKDRLIEKMKMPESERSSHHEQEKEIAHLVHKLEDAENRYMEVLEDNESLRSEVRDLHLEMEEMHDQFKEEEALEFRELQKELEATAKNCRILQFKLRKSERRNEQLEGDRIQYEDKIRQLESRFEGSDDKQHIHELEEELKMAKEVSVRLHDELELVEEKRQRYEEELDRVNDILTESESRRRALQKELEAMGEEMETLHKSCKIKSSSIKDTLDVPKPPKLGEKGKDASVEYDIAQLLRDLSDSLERENDIKEQLRFTEEENAINRKKLCDLEEENESLTLQLQKMSSAKSGRFKKKDTEKDVVTEREHELKLQMELAEQEMKVLRRKMDEMEEEHLSIHKQLHEYQKQLSEVKHRDTDSDLSYDEQVQEIDKLKQELIRKDQASQRSKLQKSKSLEDTGFGPLTEQHGIGSQLKAIISEVKVFRERIAEKDKQNQHLVRENEMLKSREGSTIEVPTIKVDDSTIDDLKEENNKLEKQIEILEKKLAEEHEQLTAAIKKLENAEILKSQVIDEGKIYEKERDIARQELDVYKKQLGEAHDQVNDTREMLKQLQEEYKTTKKDLVDLQNIEKQKREEQEKEEKSKKASAASWRWEKQEMEKQLKEANKKVDDLHAELKRQQFKWKAAGEDIEKEQKLKLKMQDEIKALTETVESSEKSKKEIANQLTIVEQSMGTLREECQKEIKLIEGEKANAVSEALQKDETIKEKDNIIKIKDDIISDKEELINEKDANIKKHISELEQLTRTLNTTETELNGTIQEREQKIKALNDDVRNRDDRLKEKDDILQGINKKLKEKEHEVADMDSTIRKVMQKLKEKENEVKKYEKIAYDAETEIAALKHKIENMQKQIKSMEKERDQILMSLKESGDELELKMKESQKEKSSLKEQLSNARDELAKQDHQFVLEKQNLEIELQQLKESVHSTNLSQSVSTDDAVATLSQEKQQLIKEKQKLTDMVNSLQREINDKEVKSNEDIEELKKIICEKSKLIDDNAKHTKRLKDEINKLKEKDNDSSVKMTPIPVIHEHPEKWDKIIASKLEEQQKIFNAEKEKLDAMHELKLRNLQEQTSQLQEQVNSLRNENDKQLVLLQSSRMAITDLRSRYDTGLTTWNEEREFLIQNAKSADEKISKAQEMEKSLNDLRSQLSQEERKAKELNNALTSERNVWKAEKTTLMLRLKKAEDQAGSAAPARPKVTSSVSDFRSKFEKFGGPKVAAKTSAPGTNINVLSDAKMIEMSVYDESQKIIKDLQNQIKDIEKKRDSELKEIQNRLEKLRMDNEKERRELKSRNMTLEQENHRLMEVEKVIVNLQCQIAEDKDAWAREKAEIMRTLDSTNQQFTDTKYRINVLVPEVKKLKTITNDGDCGKVLKTSVHQSLQRMLNILEASSTRVQLRSEKKTSTGPPAFRRSMSMTEVEMNPSQETFEVKKTSNLKMSIPITIKHLTTSSSNLTQDRSRPVVRRMQSQEQDNSASRSTSRSYGLRGSFYSSGTQSAYGSRDHSPDKNIPRKVTPYPVAPPSMIITPSMTPKRASSVERDLEPVLTKQDMDTLYSKLGEIEAKADATKAIVQERGKGVRVLLKSVSMDAGGNDDPYLQKPSPSDRSPSNDHSPSGRPHLTYAAIAKMHSGLFEDAPLSQTLPASVRIGELVITPGIESLSKKTFTRRTRAESVSPSQARKAFYDNHGKPSYFSLGRHAGRKTKEPVTLTASEQDIPIVVVPKYESDVEDNSTSTARKSRPRYDSDVEDMDYKSSSKSGFSPANFLKSVNARRKLFVMKRSSSVEASRVGSSTVQAGVQALSPAAPSGFMPSKTETYESETDDNNTLKKKKKKDKDKDKEKKEKKKKRDSSVDSRLGFKKKTRDSSVESVNRDTEDEGKKVKKKKKDKDKDKDNDKSKDSDKKEKKKKKKDKDSSD